MKTFQDVEDYIANAPTQSREKLKEMRAIIQSSIPEANESISYGMPAYKLDGPLVYFAGYAKHIGFYPTNSGITAFAPELSQYKSSKGAVQFPLDKALPIALIKKIIRFRVKENKDKALLKKKK